MIKCALFDIDNTLLFKKPTIVEKVFELAQTQKPSLRLEQVEKAYAASELWQGGQIRKENETGIRMSDEEYLQNVARVYQRELAMDTGMYEELCQLFGRRYGGEYQIMPGVREGLSQIKEAGIRMGVVSNNHSGVRRILSDFGLEQFFGCVVISEEVNLYKPDPKILEYACSQLGVACGQSVYVGDHPFDVLCAHAAGMPAIWMPANRFMEIPAYISAPEYTARSFQESIEILMVGSH